jgi:broad specificity phosphatase PhoE
MVTITFFAHGTTTDNEKHLSSGWSDVELSPLGIQQSKDLIEQTKDKYFDVIFCSDQQRAVKSAEITWGTTGVPIIPDKRLRECNYGDLNAGPSSVVEPMQEANPDRPFPNGESYEDVKTRVADFLAMLKKDYDGKSVAIVAHKAPQLSLDVLLKGMSWEQALAQDWRKTHAWQPGWSYTLL